MTALKQHLYLTMSYFPLLQATNHTRAPLGGVQPPAAPASTGWKSRGAGLRAPGTHQLPWRETALHSIAPALPQICFAWRRWPLGHGFTVPTREPASTAAGPIPPAASPLPRTGAGMGKRLTALLGRGPAGQAPARRLPHGACGSAAPAGRLAAVPAPAGALSPSTTLTSAQPPGSKSSPDTRPCYSADSAESCVKLPEGCSPDPPAFPHPVRTAERHSPAQARPSRRARRHLSLPPGCG